MLARQNLNFAPCIFQSYQTGYRSTTINSQKARDVCQLTTVNYLWVN